MNKTQAAPKVICPFCGKKWTARVGEPSCCIGFGMSKIEDGNLGIQLGSGWLFPCAKCTRKLSDYFMERAADRRDGKEPAHE